MVKENEKVKIELDKYYKLPDDTIFRLKDYSIKNGNAKIKAYRLVGSIEFDYKFTCWSRAIPESVFFC